MYKLVLGMGFGDEGKGLVTDWLCSQSPNPLVVRFNGGHQAGHTVVRNGIRHIFSNFGSGTLLGVPTYWSKYCTIEPVGLLRELADLKKKGVNPKLYIDMESPIVTPYDILINKVTEGIYKHGSCGVGFGATIQREEKHYTLRYIDILFPQIFKARLEAIKNLYSHISAPENQLQEFLKACEELRVGNNISSVTGLEDISKSYTDIIFEGAQGLLLDQNFGIFPNVTRSNTGSRNVVKILKEIYGENIPNIKLYLVTRAYQTRHGNGFMSNENLPHNISENPLETNVQHDYQGNFRRSLLDLDLILQPRLRDKFISNTDRHLFITCLDQIKNEYRFTQGEEIINCKNEGEFISEVSLRLGVGKVYTSHGDTAEHIKEFNGIALYHGDLENNKAGECKDYSPNLNLEGV